MDVSLGDFRRINKYLWELPPGFTKHMKVAARIYASEKILKNALKDESLKQLTNLASLGGVKSYVLAMPDIHEGYGFPIGGVAAIDYKTGGILPGGVGFDINCGIRLLKTKLRVNDVFKKINKLIESLYLKIPSGLGRERKKILFNLKEINKILNYGADFIVESGYGLNDDLVLTEEGGKLLSASADKVSILAKERGMNQLGTLGSGNHFLEIQKIEKIFDIKKAKIFGLFDNQVVIMIHTGSRGLGHQVASDYLKKFLENNKNSLIDRELVAMPFLSESGQSYFKAMNAAANFAFANRQLITHFVREAFRNIYGNNYGNVDVFYDVAHNIAKLESYDGRKLLIHRKGATRAFPPGSINIPKIYYKTGQPIIVPGTMGTSSYILVGKEKAKESFYSVCHGAGRTMSRKKSLKTIKKKDVFDNLKNKGIIIKSDNLKRIVEESPEAYKNIDEVVKSILGAGLAGLVAKLAPVAVIKG